MRLGSIADDDRAPVIVSGPTRLRNFDPSGTLAFRFSHPMNPATLTANQFIVEEERNGSWIAVQGTVKLSEGNTVATFVPTAGLKLGQKYRIRFAGISSTAGKQLLAQTLELETFKPERMCSGGFGACSVTFPLVTPAGRPIPLRDIAIHRKSVAGGQLTTNLVTITDTNSSFPTDRLITFDVTNPEMVTQLGTAGGGAGRDGSRSYRA